MKKNVWKRAFAVILAMALLGGMILPAHVFAAAPKTTITLSTQKVTLYPAVEGRKTYTLRVKTTGNIGGKIKFSSSNKNVARITNKGVITGVGIGNATITVYTPKAKTTCTVVCYRPALRMETPTSLTLKEGATSQIKVSTAPVAKTISYSSSNSAIASVTTAGKVYARKAGRATISIKANGLTRTVSVTVTGKTPTVQTLAWNNGWEFAGHSKIHTGVVKLYRAAASNGIVVAVNAGHGTQGGESVRTLCHPDGSPKVTGGSTAAGSVYAVSVSSGMQFLDGTPEGTATLSAALIVRDKLLAAGFDVLMIRETADTQLDNIARTVFANQYADCHISIHYDSSTNNKGAFCIGVPAISSYRNMYPVSTHWQKTDLLGQYLINGMRNNGVKIYGSWNVPMDLTQTSYSKIPTIDLEVGDAASDHGTYTQTLIANGIVAGVKAYFGKSR